MKARERIQCFRESPGYFTHRFDMNSRMNTIRQSVKGKQVSLFVTCLIDLLSPQTGISVVRILEHLGVQVNFPPRQTCCGQPGYNGGYRLDALRVASHFLDVFADAEAVVVPSGSCTAMIRHEYPRLFADDPMRLKLAQYLGSVTWEFTEFLVDGLGIVEMGLKLPVQQTFAVHDACHGLRMLGLRDTSRTLLEHVENAVLTELVEHDECCGFGGLFSVKMADVSSAMLEKKIERINACSADAIVTGDISCLIHINGGLSRQKSPRRVRHIAEVLADGLPGKASL
jgi:L-lactate dehydrogenase complex protein LldE